MTIRSIEEVMWKAKRIPHEQARRESEDYLELVMSWDSLQEIMILFEGYFGPALKPAGAEACERSAKLTENYGGIETNQILYYTEKEKQSNAAMIWPWNDGRRATVKIIQGCS
jgi:hypothetical protein